LLRLIIALKEEREKEIGSFKLRFIKCDGRMAADEGRFFVGVGGVGGVGASARALCSSSSSSLRCDEVVSRFQFKHILLI